jgi:hypothetical protein
VKLDCNPLNGAEIVIHESRATEGAPLVIHSIEVRRFNDCFRRSGSGGGKRLMTAGIAALPYPEQAAILSLTERSIWRISGQRNGPRLPRRGLARNAPTKR